MAPLRFGLIGTGYWALHTHATALSSSPDAVLHGVWGRDAAKATELAGRLGARAYEDLDLLFDQVDAVAMAVPPDIQAEIAVRAARAGRHLLLDKPLALSVDAARNVVRAVDESGVASVVFYTARFRPDIEDWAQMARASGPWQSANLVHYANIYQPGSPYAASAWRREHGALWDVGPHALAALLPLLGPVSALSARRGPVGTDTVHLVLSHGELAPVPAAVAAVVPESPPNETVSTSTVSLSLTMAPAATASQLVLYGEHGTRRRPEGNFEPAEAFGRAVAELAELVRTGRRAHRCDVHFGLEVVRVLAAAERALDLPGIELRY